MNDQLRDLAKIDLNLLVSLQVLLEEKSVTAAGDRVGLSQPAMSHSLRRLRKMLGDEILIRKGAGSVLTPRGQELVGPLREVLLRTSYLVGGRRFDPNTSRRSLSIAMSSAVAYILGQQLSLLMDVHAPLMSLRILITDDITEKVFTELGADVLLLAEGYPTPFPRSRLFDDQWVVVGGVPELKERDTISCLQDWPHVGLQSAVATRPYEILSQRGVGVTMQTLVSDYLVLPQFVAGVRKVALHRRKVVERMAQTLPLYVVDFPFPILGLGVDIVQNPWQSDEFFQQWVAEILGQAVNMHAVNDPN
ncbi:LysR family transcriptional regulator [Corynebacterium glutamicum MT]|uniref:LysR family transcriptional regulator n=1 Tax=Corynebacterium glutamicum TaxID=1718 RepID=A0AB36IAE0_CORGT|nr:LysR family transcriptional regulator [Corynebacterium glutamicum]AGN18812.1 LysR family transcriptional regulator [Corynebacterium glutamicum SCgG1]AGN21835.1 LysR family transcriptional regulator [Corynebacterium glutamicum SCgG2]EOA65055.1 LysR family transcriptional regulator [Corynebacterium glutamicum MT]EPP41164.1 LysR family transcriptional regulator [Corynebacterium glutamicum Z188]NII87706.1 DNA-binding transcriptional LysR family regulator [Corynebacterium glutamicum]